MEKLFTFVDSSLQGTPALALGVTFLWGVLSILLSPCHLSSIPLVVGFISGQKDLTFRRALAISSLFSLGILITMALLGVLASLLGFIVFSRIGVWGNVLVVVVFFLVGLHLLGVLPLPFLSSMEQPKYKKRGLLSAFIMGLVFGIALGPCTFAFMMPVLSVVVTQAGVNPFYAGALLVVYAVGHCLVIVVAGSSFELVERYLKWNETSKMGTIVKKVSGALVLLAGCYMLFKTVKMLLGHF